MNYRQELRGYIDILSEGDFVIPTKEEYYRYIQNFQAGNSEIDYAIRNLAVLDDEETRITDDYKQAKEQNLLDVWANRWKPQLSNQEIGMIQNALETADVVPSSPYKWVDIVRNILEPHISNKDLYQAHDAYWAELFFASTEDKPYDEFVADIKDMGL